MRKWQGKTWGTLGDSISAAGGYQPLVQQELGFSEVKNYGVSGCPMTAGGERDHGATVHIAKQIDASLDCITIYAGINDFRLNKPLGQQGTEDPMTFRGAYTSAVEHILYSNPSGRLNLWTPLQRDKDGYDMFFTNESGHRLIDYVEAIQEIGAAYALPVLDLYASSGFNKITLPVFTTDGLHPNQAGYERIAGLAAAFLLQL